MSDTLPNILIGVEPVTLDERAKALAERIAVVESTSESLKNDEQRLETELAAVRATLEGTRRKLPIAKTMVATPCDESWDAMTGDDRKRFCNSCKKNVHNLSAMTSLEVEEFLLDSANGEACIRLYEREDGTVLTADCPVGVSRRRRRAILLTTLTIGSCALFAFTAVAFTLRLATQPPPPPEKIVITVPGPTIHVPGPAFAVPSIPSGYEKMPELSGELGWVLLQGPTGTKVFEGKRLVGTLPMVAALKTGSHTLRAEGVEDGKPWSSTESVDVKAKKRAEVSFSAPASQSCRIPFGDEPRLMGKRAFNTNRL